MIRINGIRIKHFEVIRFQKLNIVVNGKWIIVNGFISSADGVSEINVPSLA